MLTAVARANVLALTTQEAGGERFLIHAEELFANDIALVGHIVQTPANK